MSAMQTIKKGRAICFDCDGVIHKYRDGYRDGSIYDEPNTEIIGLIAALQSFGFPVFICSTRDPKQIVEWWNKHKFGAEAVEFPDDVVFWKDCKHIAVTNKKKPAQLYIDDHGYHYYGQSIETIIASLEIIK